MTNDNYSIVNHRVYLVKNNKSLIKYYRRISIYLILKENKDFFINYVIYFCIKVNEEKENNLGFGDQFGWVLGFFLVITSFQPKFGVGTFSI